MMLTRLIGVAVGVALGWLVVDRVIESRPLAPPAGAILSECAGEIRELAIHYVAGNADVLAVYRGFLPLLSPRVVVHVVCPAQADFEELVAAVEPVRCELRAVVAGHPITCWSRDRWIALAPVAPDAPVTLACPYAEAGADVLPARRGDERVAHALAGASAGRTFARRSELLFDAGDFLADEYTVFVATERLQRANLGRTVTDRAALVDHLTRLLGRQIVMLDPAPDHHLGMFMMAAPNRTMLVADPSMGGANGSDPASKALQAAFDHVAEQVASAGYRVVRMPVVVPPDGRSYLTWVNVLLDFPPGARPIVYMPTYQGVEQLNLLAESIWSDLGFDIRRVDCTTTYRHAGNLHCLVNVVRRSAS